MVMFCSDVYFAQCTCTLAITVIVFKRAYCSSAVIAVAWTIISDGQL